MKIVNRSHYNTRDLTRLLKKACEAMACRDDKVFVILPSKARYTRGCAEVGPSPYGGRESTGVAIEIASPSRFSFRKFGRIVQHELLHTLGIEHEYMTREEYWSFGPMPDWCMGERLRHESGFVFYAGKTGRRS